MNRGESFIRVMLGCVVLNLTYKTFFETAI